MRIAWLSDIHLDFLNENTIQLFYEMLTTTFADAILIGGDIGESHNVCDYLLQIAQQSQLPIYFVLGNHDFYGSSILSVRNDVKSLCKNEANLYYLSNLDEVVELGASTALIGHDGWADLQYGDFKYSTVWMRDYSEITELKGLKKVGLLPVMEEFGKEAASHIQKIMNRAVKKYDNIIILTHVPPFKEACWHEGKISDKEWLPHFTCKAIGDVIKQISLDYPHKQFRVLCGHTHGSGKAIILPNLRVLTKGAEYGELRQPTIAAFK